MEVIAIAVRIADKLGQFNDGDYMLVDASAVEYKQADGSSISVQQALENSIDKLTKEGVEGLLGLTKEEIEAMADLILDTEVRIDKTYSSSKIYSAIQDAIDSSKSFTLAEIGKMSGASYKVVASTTEMTDEKIIYLLENGTTYDMYIVETTGTVTKIGDTTIDLSSYLKVTDAESTYLKKTEATSTYVAQTSFNNHITDTVAHLTQFEKNKLLTTDNITSTINNSSDNTQVPSAKATYDLANTKADASHTHITSDIKDLSIPTKVSDLENDRGYLTKADANKLNCVTIDNVSLKEYILTNFTETGKTYYLIAKTTCTDLPKASNFYITVETPGLYTYKVTAKELNDSNGIYVCTYRTISSSWTAWEKELITGDITTNAKTYCLLSQLGITTPCTIKDIWDKMPSGSVTIVDVDSSIITDLDVIRIALGISDNDEVYGILTVVKLKQRTTLEFRRARTGRAMIPDTFIGYCKGSDCTSIQWRKDVDSTEINIKLTQLENTINEVDDKVIETIANPTELDTDKYIKNGFYSIGDATKRTNLPTQKVGTLLVYYAGHYVIQEYILNETLRRFMRRSVDKGKNWSDWQIVCTTTVEDVGVTTITPVNSAITGNIEYAVKNGICYVSMKDLMSTISSTNLLISTTMPKPSINCTASSVDASGNIAMIYIDKNTTNLRGNFYTKNAKSNCSFSYPVAE